MMAVLEILFRILPSRKDRNVGDIVLNNGRRRAWELGQGRFSWEEEQSVLLAVVDKALRGAP
ncbi:hypothetical protein [Prosthecomicrobium pneumaticum]|uniref:Uncharacterized protein n=1 Tax=Prosthecomicrobium pneumaticum TaxID=81895 RepID=A0A7W9FJV0_9HYPH|nr:hypothetical protein [Prosthecomicrobium pneumaticum]MBB5751870.1 hypothetical protein [Prosthecomicrobium pneumaticum]